MRKNFIVEKATKEDTREDADFLNTNMSIRKTTAENISESVSAVPTVLIMRKYPKRISQKSRKTEL